MSEPAPLQGTVSRFDPDTRGGLVLLDDGTELGFDAAALTGTGVRLLRPGQRVRLTTDDAVPPGLLRVQLLTLG